MFWNSVFQKDLCSFHQKLHSKRPAKTKIKGKAKIKTPKKDASQITSGDSGIRLSGIVSKFWAFDGKTVECHEDFNGELENKHEVQKYHAIFVSLCLAESSSHESETKHNHLQQIVCNIPAELRKKDVSTGLHGIFLTHLGHIFTYLHQHLQEQTQLQPLQLLQHPRRVHVPLLVEMDLPWNPHGCLKVASVSGLRFHNLPLDKPIYKSLIIPVNVVVAKCSLGYCMFSTSLHSFG